MIQNFSRTSVDGRAMARILSVTLQMGGGTDETKILGKAIFDSSIRGWGNARQYSQAIRLSDRGVFTFGDREPPKNHRMGEGAQDTAVALHSPNMGQSSG